MASLPDPCIGIVIELAPNSFYQLKSLSITKNRNAGGSSAQCTIELPIGLALPRPPQLAAIISTDRSKIYFNGLYLNESVSFKDNGQTREYQITINDLFAYTRKKVINGYKQNVPLEFHLSNLLTLGGVFQEGYHIFSYGLIAEETITFGINTFSPNDDPIDFSFETGYLNEALDNLASLSGFSWELRQISWRPGNLPGTALGVILFRQNNLPASIGPKDKLTIPESYAIICPDMFWYESVKFSNQAPTISQVTMLGVNGRPNETGEDELQVGSGIINLSSFSKTEVIIRDIPVDSVRTTFDFPEQVTRVVAAKIIAND